MLLKKTFWTRLLLKMLYLSIFFNIRQPHRSKWRHLQNQWLAENGALPRQRVCEGTNVVGDEKKRSFGNVRLSLRFFRIFFLQIQQKEWSNSFRRGQQYTRLSVGRPAEGGRHQVCPAFPLCKSMEARHGQVLRGSLCLFLDFLMARKVERTILLSVLATITGL